MKSGGIEVLECSSMNLHCLQTVTGIVYQGMFIGSLAYLPFIFHQGLKFLLLTDKGQPNTDTILRKIYELYADYVMKNPFHNPEMPIKCQDFVLKLQVYIKSVST